MLLLLLAVILLVGYGVARLTGLYQPITYKAVVHKEKIHYVPKNCKLNAPLEDFPTRPPRKDEMITADGEMVTVESDE